MAALEPAIPAQIYIACAADIYWSSCLHPDIYIACAAPIACAADIYCSTCCFAAACHILHSAQCCCSINCILHQLLIFVLHQLLVLQHVAKLHILNLLAHHSGRHMLVAQSKVGALHTALCELGDHCTASAVNQLCV